MVFKKLAQYFEELEKTASRLKITEILANLFAQASPEEIDKITYLALGRLAPAYEGVEFNLAEKLLIKAIALTTGTNQEIVRKLYKKTGDLGETIIQLKSDPGRAGKLTVKSQGLFGEENKIDNKMTVVEVYERLLGIAKDNGAGSVERKVAGMAKLLGELEPIAAKFVVRMPLGRLRLGFSELTVIDALSWGLMGDKSKREEIEQAYEVRADIGYVAKVIKAKGIQGLKGVKVALGTPVVPALCQRLPDPEEMIKKMGKVAVEPKYDGTRLQLHLSKLDGIVKAFTRSLENVSAMYPDVIQAALAEIKAKQVILDGELVGYDPKTGNYLPFQETMKRKRKHEIEAMSKTIPLRYFVFDVLMCEGEELLKTTLAKRREILEKIIPANNKIVLSPQIVTDDPARLRQFHDQQIEDGLEGVVCKKWESFYDPGRRGYSWVKFKSEMTKKGGGLADTLDCVVMGIYKGRGKRVSFGAGAFLVGIRKKEKSEEIVTISKIGTGLTDEQWRELKNRSNKLTAKSKQSNYEVNKNLEADIWLKPELVVEIQADNVTVSTLHTAGLALRFPRLVRFRDDKTVRQVTTLREAQKLYKMQK